MKRKRRIEVHIEHRELSVYSTFPVEQPGAYAGSGLRETRPETCPVCGSEEMVPLAEGMNVAGLTMAVLREGLEKSRFHMQRTDSGAWWVCRDSLHLS